MSDNSSYKRCAVLGRGIFAVLVFILICAATVIADDGTAGAAPDAHAPAKASVRKVIALDNNGNEASRATTNGCRIRVTVDGVLAASNAELQKLVPFLDGHPFKGTHPELVDAQTGTLEFNLPSKTEAKERWKPILSNPPWDGVRTVSVSVGPEEGGLEWPPKDYKNRPQLAITLFSADRGVLLIFAGIVFGSLCWLAAYSRILRDSDSTPRPADVKERPPFSLAKTQAAFWFLLVFAAFLFLWGLTGDFNGIITANTLALIGIGSGTTLGAAMVEAGKSEQEQKKRDESESQLQAKEAALLATTTEAEKPALNEEIKTLKETLWPASHGVKDLLTDVNGITLHRFQMLVWTLTLGVIFVVGVCQNLAMPQFDQTLLALMGISSGVYLGFKIPEKQM